MEQELRVQLGRTWMSAGDLARLEAGSSIELDVAPDDPVELLVAGRRIGEGTVAVMDGTFCVRVTRVASGAPAVEASSTA